MFTRLSTAFVGNASKPSSHALWRAVDGGGVRSDVPRAALEWVRAHGAGYRADVSRVAMIGRSAGAHLALMAAYDSPALPIKAVC